jgi:asparagine synthetase B (glutamine-hydrolysing)
MISYPKNWMKIGQSITHIEIENTIMKVLCRLNCNSLSFSGGLDSSLMLYYMLKIHDKVHAFTMGVSELHPDIKYSKLVVSHLNNVIHKIYIPSSEEIESIEQYSGDFEGDGAVRLFYKYVHKYTDKIVACDGVDEFMCGYYGHQKSPCENTYYTYLRQLSQSHLVPLHKHSGNVKVFLPYLDDELLLLFSQISLNKKVDKTHRKKLLVNMSKGKIPDEVINRRKYGFCDVLKIK